MAAATVTFSVVDGRALRPLAFASPERLVGISLAGCLRACGIPSPPARLRTSMCRTSSQLLSG
jgi:hypothetical protein